MFETLARHFARRLAQAGAEESGDVDLSLGALLTLLASPGVFIAIGLLDRYSSLLRYFRGKPVLQDMYPRAVGDGYTLLVFSMAVTGLVTLWKWDRILPDPADQLNLAPLPIPARRLFTASLAAIAVVVCAFIIDVNAGSMFIFPMVVTADQHSAGAFLRLAMAHFLVLLLGSAFTFCACFSLMGVLIAAAPARWFPGLSIVARALAGFLLLAMWMTSGRGHVWLRMLKTGTATWQAWSPPLWFASLYGPLIGRDDLSADGLWQRGLWGLGIAAAVSLAGYGLGYRRGMDGRLMRQARRRRWPEWLMRQGATPLERAAFRYSLLTLWRSERHSLLVIALLGAGLVIGGLQGRVERLPFFAGYSLTVALVVAFHVAALPHANWPFRLLAVAEHDEPRRVARRLLWLHVAAIVVLPTLLMAPLTVTFTLLLMQAFLIEILVLDFRHIPFTVRTAGFRSSRLVYALGGLVGLGILPWAGGRIADWVEPKLWRGLAPLAIAAVAWRYRRVAVEEIASGRAELEFEDSAEEMIRLGL